MEFNEEQKKEASELARDSIKDITSSLAKIEDTIGQRRLENLYQIRQWQQNLLTLVFAIMGTMIPIFYAVDRLPPHKIPFFIGLALLAFTGIYIADHIKKTLEADARDLPNMFNDLKTELRKNRDVAAELFLNPTRKNTLEYMKSNDAFAEVGTGKLLDHASKQRPSFTNDILIALFIASLYLMLGGVIENNRLYWVGLAILILYFFINAIVDWSKIRKALDLREKDIKDMADHVSRTPKR